MLYTDLIPCPPRWGNKFKDITGQRFGNLTVKQVIGRRYENHHYAAIWECLCDCGAITHVPSALLIRKNTKTCGTNCPIGRAANSMRRVKDMIGQRFHKLVVREQVPRPDGLVCKGAWWLCDCDCGGTITTRGTNLRNGHTKSCGCIHIERIRELQAKLCRKHGLTGHPLYDIYIGMMYRCTNSKCEQWENYGGRVHPGPITVCEQWSIRENAQGLKQFIEDMAPTYQPGLTLDRIDNNKGYAPDNCRWATSLEQRRNQRNPVRNSRYAAVVAQRDRLASLLQDNVNLVRRLESMLVKRDPVFAEVITEHGFMEIPEFSFVGI